MRITRDNYEQFFLDFAEGRMNPAMQNELEMFLQKNPDLKKELEEFENISVSENIKFHPKSSLKKNFVPVGKITENNYHDYLIGEIEGDLNDAEKEELKSFIVKNPFIEKEQKILWKTILLPDEKIVFENKLLLMKTPVIQMYWKRTAAALALAASVLLVLYFNFREDKNPIVEKKQEISPKIEIAIPKIQKEQIAEISKEKIIRRKEKSQQSSVEGRQIKVANSETENKQEEKIAEEPIVKNKTEEPVIIKKDNVINAEKISEKDIVPKQEETPLIVEKTEIKKESEIFTLKEFLAFAFKKKVLKEKVSKKDAKITPVDWASAVVKATSKIFNAKMKKNYNSDGELASISVCTRRFEVSRTLHKK